MKRKTILIITMILAAILAVGFAVYAGDSGGSTEGVGPVIERINVLKTDNRFLPKSLLFDIDEDKKEIGCRLGIDEAYGCEVIADVYVSDVNSKVTFVLADGEKLAVRDENGNVTEYTVKLEKPSFFIPCVYITKNNRMQGFDRENYIRVDVTYLDGENSEYVQGVNMKIRGNSTSGFEKKPFRLKFGYPVEFGDMGSFKNWVLLANYSDKSLIHTDLATIIAKELPGQTYVPDMEQVRLFIDGNYWGLYDLGHHVEVADGKIEIGDTDITECGFFLEIDARYYEEGYEIGKNCFMVDNAYFCIKEPKEITHEQFEYIRDYVLKVDKLIKAKDPKVFDYIDVESFTDWFITNEFSLNNDCAMFLSVFFYKNSDGKLCIGPIWDFDLAFGNYLAAANYTGTGWAIKHSMWWNELCEIDLFESTLLDHWTNFSENTIPKLYEYADMFEKDYKDAYEENFKRWKILGIYVWDNPDNVAKAATMEEQFKILRDYMAIRKDWLDSNIKRICTD